MRARTQWHMAVKQPAAFSCWLTTRYTRPCSADQHFAEQTDRYPQRTRVPCNHVPHACRWRGGCCWSAGSCWRTTCWWYRAWRQVRGADGGPRAGAGVGRESGMGYANGHVCAEVHMVGGPVGQGGRVHRTSVYLFYIKVSLGPKAEARGRAAPRCGSGVGAWSLLSCGSWLPRLPCPYECGNACLKVTHAARARVVPA